MTFVWKVAILVGVWGAFVFHYTGAIDRPAPVSELGSVQVYTFNRPLEQPLGTELGSCVSRDLKAVVGKRCAP